MEISFNSIIVDSFNFYLQVRDKTKNYKDNVLTCIEYINKYLYRISEDGFLYMVFDPLPTNSKFNLDFTGSNLKAKVVSYYKENRKGLSSEDLQGIFLLRDYCLERDPQLKLVEGGSLEGDDFVYYLTNLHKGQNIALITTDSDWCRYLDDTISVYTPGLKLLNSKELFYDKYNFYPTELSVILYKTFFGDAADNIKPLIEKIRVNFKENIERLFKNYVIEISRNNETYEDYVKRISVNTFTQDFLTKKTPDKGREAEYEVVCQIFNSSKYISTNLIRNLLEKMEIIQTFTKKDLGKYIKEFKCIDKTYKSLVDQKLGLNKTKIFGK